MVGPGAVDEHGLLSELRQGAEGIARLSENEESFRAAIDAYRAVDGESLQALLGRHELLEFCRPICHWFCTKECVLLCLELCGPPRLEDEEVPDIREFAKVVARVTEDEELVELLATAVQERDPDSWRELIEKHELQRFCHLLCHWVCAVHCRLICEVVCGPLPQKQRPHLIPELQAAGAAIGTLAADEKAFTSAIEAVRTDNCELLRGILTNARIDPFCRLVCEWFCSWRCVLVCLPLCRAFPLESPESPIEEMLQFAQAVGKLSQVPNALERLSAAVARQDAERFGALVKEFDFERFCIQFCHWVCSLRCRRFCFCVCPPRTIGVFTKIGGLYYNTDVHSHAPGNGLTVADGRAFFDTLRLNGGLSVVDGAPLVEYRFETVATSADGSTLADGKPILPSSWAPVAPAQIRETNIGSFIRPVLGPPFLEEIEVWVNKSGSGIFTITPSADGWIEVPPMFPVAPMVSGSGWRFVPGSDLIALDTTTLKPYVESIDETGVGAGESANAPLQTDVHYGIRMRMRDQGESGDGTEAGTCSHIAINNTRYNNISHHPYWPGGLYGATNELAVASVGIAELASKPCSLLTEGLTVQFTAAHSNLGSVSAWLEGPGGPYAFDLNPATAEDPGENWYGTATPAIVGSPPAPAWTFEALPPCAYLLKLSVSVLLTTGDAVPDPIVDYIAFCKG
jgi:hypothetical protein